LVLNCTKRGKAGSKGGIKANGLFEIIGGGVKSTEGRKNIALVEMRKGISGIKLDCLAENFDGLL
jgi:hypothetical protein